MLQQQHAAAPTFKLVTLDQLELSPENVATIGRNEVSDLVASIRAHGLQQNLVVAEGPDGYLVKAGGRRLRALRVLAGTGDWEEGREIPVAVLGAGASAREVSAAENLVRADMHPVDESEAFRAIVEDEGASIEEVAARFGRPSRYVRQRLKLANVSPAIIEQFRAGAIRLSQVEALSISHDHAEQERVWKNAQRRGHWQQEPDHLRDELTAKELSVAKDPVASYLGVEDYEAGGGIARRDLFGAEEDAWLPDSKLARSLAKEKLDQAAKAYRSEGWAWFEVRLEFTLEDSRAYGVFGAGKYDYVDTKKAKWPKGAKAVSGMVVCLSSAGTVEVHRGLVRAADAKKAAAEAKSKQVPVEGHTRAAPTKQPGQLSFAQVQRLQGHRTAVLRKHLASDPTLALAALAADLWRDQGLGETNLTRCSRSDQQIVRISGERHFTVPPNIREAIEEHPSTKDLHGLEASWVERIHPGKGRLFGWLLEQPDSLTHELLAFLAARTVVAGETLDKGKDRGAEFAQAAGVDMVEHWTPSLLWLEAQPTSVIEAAVSEALGKKAAGDLRKLKGKTAKASRAAELLAGSGWIPKPLRTPAPKVRDKKTVHRGKLAAAGDVAPLM